MKNHYLAPVFGFVSAFLLCLFVASHCFAQDTVVAKQTVTTSTVATQDHGSASYLLSVVEKLVSTNCYATIIAVISILGVVLSFIPESIVPANGILHAIYLFLRYTTQAFIKK